ncbi:MAG: hypothetical protein MUF08_01430 [Burkholderiaceae bacterium]|jgi:hypothetical protein|nr:hypothetical protein [Burkholderiaceae bacterium]
MEDLLLLNIFTHSLPAAVLGMGFFGGLIVLPLFFVLDLCGTQRGTRLAQPR